MSTYYYLHCSKCDVSEISFTRQAWGWGNVYPDETFDFLTHHTRECGEESICVVSEYDERAYPDNESDSHVGACSKNGLIFTPTAQKHVWARLTSGGADLVAEAAFRRIYRCDPPDGGGR